MVDILLDISIYMGKNFDMSNPSPKLKLCLYIMTASLASLLADLNHYVAAHSTTTLEGASVIRWVIIVINFVLQGLIAWRAFLDDSSGPPSGPLQH